MRRCGFSSRERFRTCLLGVGACWSFTLPLVAQSLRGRIFQPDSVSPAMGVVVTAVGGDGKVAASALSAPSGEYSFRLLAPGRYQLRVLQIGFQPTVIDGVAVPPAGDQRQNVVLGGLPVTISGMVVEERRGCALSGSEGVKFVQVWGQARIALTATRLSEQAGLLDVRAVTLAGHVDAVGFHGDPQLGRYLRAPNPDGDTLHVKEAIVDRVFASTAPETLMTEGYVRRRRDSSFVFDTPNAETLLSDEFAAQHCFNLVGTTPDHPEWIGIAFAPRSTRKGVVDARGVLWLNRTSAELRRLDFEYTNLPPGKFTVCDSEPDPLAHLHDGPVCDTYGDPLRLGLGGSLDFLRMATGEWLVGHWIIRTPPDAEKWRSSGIRSRLVGPGNWEKCSAGRDCVETWIPWPRLVTTSGMISSVRRGGVELYRDEAAQKMIADAATKRAGLRPARISGAVTDLDGRPLVNAIVQLEEPSRVANTNSLGTFEIAPLPPGKITVSVRCRGYQTVRFSLTLLADSTRHLQLTLPTPAPAGATDCSKAS